MDTLTRQIENEVTPGVSYCACCTPPQLLIPRDDVGAPERWAVCVATGAWYERGDNGRFAAAPAPRQGDLVVARPAVLRAAGQWTGGDALPAIVPGVRIDLSKESYA